MPSPYRVRGSVSDLWLAPLRPGFPSPSYLGSMRRWRLLRNRDFMLLWSGGVLSEFGSQTSAVAYPLLILALTGSAAKAGIVGLAKWLPLAIFSLPAGALADRLDRKRLMIACDAVRMLGAASIVAALWLSRPPYVQVVLVAFVDGALFITAEICQRGALAQVVDRDQLQDAVAQQEARYFSGAIVGPPLGGALFSAARALPFLADAVSFVCSMTAISLTRARFQSSAASQPRHKRRGSFFDGFSWMRAHPFFRTAALLFAAGNPVFTGLYLLAVLLAKRHGASAAHVGLMFAIVGVGGLLGAVVAGPLRRRMSARAVLAGENWLLAAAVIALLAVHNALLIGLLIAVAEFGTPVGNSLVAGSRVAAAPDHLQGRVAAVATVASMSLAWVGPLVVGLAFEHAGPTATVLIVGGWATALAMITTLAPALRTPPRAAP